MLQANRRRIALWLALLLALILLGARLSRTSWDTTALADDFVEYWAAGRLNITGGNPYAADELWPLQQAAGRVTEPLMMWNPPYTLALVMPFGLLGYPLSRLIWLALSIVLIELAAFWTWGTLHGPRKAGWVALLLAISFFPSLVVLRMGQVGPILLLGLAGFLHYERKGKYWLAGVFAALLAIKPHLLYLVGIAILVWSVRRRQWGVLGGAALTLAAATALAVAVNPSVIQQYVQANIDSSPLIWMTPTAGSLLRLCFGGEHLWLQFVFVLPGLAWFAAYSVCHRADWVWAERMPLALLVSVITTPFGWSFDLVVLVPIVLGVAVLVATRAKSRATPALIISYLLMNAIAWGLYGRTLDLWQVWLAPALLAWYLLTIRRIGGSPLVSARADHAPSIDMGIESIDR
jgi:hypothetical protein